MATGVLEAHPSVGDDASSMEEVVDHQEVDEKVQQVGGKRKKVEDETEEGGVGEEDEKEEAQELEEEEVRTPEIKVRKRRSVSKQQATPIERPSREKRVVERYSSSAPRRNSSSKSVPINQGSGTKLRDIPNVLFKLSKRKADESLQHLHRIFFGKKAKAHYLKRSLLEFSGFVWAESKEKEKSKLNDKLDRCVKDKLLDFCDVLDISVARATTKKEDLVSLLLDFLQSPHVTRDVSLEKKELAKKRKRAASKTGSEKKSGEKTKRQRRRSTKIEEDENDVEVKEDKGEDEDEDVGNANNNGVDGSEKDSDLEKNDPEEETKESGPRTLQKSPDKKERKRVKSIANVEKITSEKKKSKKNETLKRKRQRSSTTNIEKSSPNKRGSAKTKSQKNKSQKNKDSSTEEKSTDKIQGTRANSGKTVLSPPTLKELHDVVSDILKEVDFNTATLADILKQLGTHFGMNLSDRKADVKNIIEDVISNMTDDENEDGEGDNNEVEEKKDSVEEKSEGDDDTEKTPEKIENREESFEEEDGAQEKDDGAQEEDDSAQEEDDGVQEEDDGVQEEDDGVQEEDGAQEDDGVEEDDDAKEVEEKKCDAKETPEGGDVMNNSVKIGNKEVDKNVQEDDEDA
ncbi:Protein DEK [Zostera marina]|uniref:Protein DEK n=1 Tax=Zostera marina TaxID=29655 RepID=A0A0K9PDG2_ZOSMR|nr:Protein DEK [Zostera marina]